MIGEIGKIFLIKPQSLSAEEISFYRDLSFQNFIFFKEHFLNDFKDYLAQLKGHLKSLRFLAVDQEGGRVCRIEGDFEAPYEIAKEATRRGRRVVEGWAEKIAKTVSEFGFNLNLAPVVDLGDETAESYLQMRTFSKEPEVVSELARIFIKIHKKWGIFTALKHFPGLGGVEIDPHRELPQKKSPLEEDLYPFRALSDETDFIMTTHIVIQNWDSKPVTFSEFAINFLRKNINFRRAIITDDLNMGALKDYELPERIIYALASGHNLLIYCGDLAELIDSFDLLKREIESSRVLRNKLRDSLTILENIEH